MRYIEIGDLPIYIIYPLLLPLAWTGRLCFNVILSMHRDNRVNPFILSFFTIASNIIPGSISLRKLSLFKQRKKAKPQKEIVLKIQIIGQKNQKIKDKGKTKRKWFAYSLVILLSVCECIFITFFYFIPTTSTPGITLYEMNVILVLFSSLSTHYILGYQIYSHQKLSIVIVSMNILSLFIEQLIQSNDISATLLFLLEIVFVYFIVAILDLTQKYLMEKNYFTPLRLILLQGLFSIIIFLIAMVIVFPYIPCTDMNSYCDVNKTFGSIGFSMSTLFAGMATVDVIYFICFIAFSGIYIVLLFMTHHHFTPIHRCFSETLGAFLYWVINMMGFGLEIPFDVISFVRLILLLMASLIYNELIILNVWSLGENTRKKIMRRSCLDSFKDDDVNVVSELKLIDCQGNQKEYIYD